MWNMKRYLYVIKPWNKTIVYITIDVIFKHIFFLIQNKRCLRVSVFIMIASQVYFIRERRDYYTDTNP